MKDVSYPELTSRLNQTRCISSFIRRLITVFYLIPIYDIYAFIYQRQKLICRYILGFKNENKRIAEVEFALVVWLVLSGSGASVRASFLSESLPKGLKNRINESNSLDGVKRIRCLDASFLFLWTDWLSFFCSVVVAFKSRTGSGAGRWNEIINTWGSHAKY